jgi:lipopolysaccharide heptosyltransferase II
MNKIRFLKIIDRIIGTPLVLLLSRIPRIRIEKSEEIKKILLIRPGGIGDAVLLLPAIKLLKEKFADVRIHILCEKRNAEIFKLSRCIDHIYLYDKGLELFKCLRNKYDVVIDTEQWHRLSAMVAYLTKTKISIGFDTNERGRLFTHRIPYSHDDYEAYSFFHLIEPLIETSPFLNVHESFIDTERISTSHLSFFKETESNKDYIAIFPGASVNERKWGGERFGEVAKILQKKGYRIIILGSNTDRGDAHKIKEHAEGSLDLTGKTTLVDIAAILKTCKLLITADSGIMHIAYGVGTPTVSLFGSGREKKWAPRGEKHIVINKHLPCSPCTTFGYTPRCKRNIECLSSIRADDVLKSVETLLTHLIHKL